LSFAEKIRCGLSNWILIKSNVLQHYFCECEMSMQENGSGEEITKDGK
jgi:hypothetical protein